MNTTTARVTGCRQCGKTVVMINDFAPPTCGDSGCQQAETYICLARAKVKQKKGRVRHGV